MSTSALRPRSVTEIVDAAFQILRAHYPQFVMCSALAYAPWLVIQLIFLNGNGGQLEAPPLVPTIIAGVGVWLAFAFMSSVIITCASQSYLGEPVDVGSAMRRALPRIGRVIGAAALRYLCMFIGFLCLLVGALYVAARFFALTPTIILEDQSIGGAFRRSTHLSEGRKGHILNTLGLVGIIYWVLAFGVTIPAALTKSFVIQAVASAAYTILAYPVIAITECLLYYDARIQSEGLDIELMVDALGEPAPRAPV